MTQLRTDAAYVRKSTTSIQAFARTRPESIDVMVLGLLETPHTTVSLSRIICHGRTAPSTSDISSAMHRLLEAELIELSPDS